MPELTVTVHELVAFCHRSGDIDHRFTPSPTGVQGIAGHQQVYRRRPASYRSEYPVEYRHRRDDMVLVLRGRADGYDPDSGLVEEIKTCRVNPAHIPPAASRMHLAQARLYAAIIALERDVEQLEVRLTWFNLDTGRESPLSQVYTRGELQQFLTDSLAAFASWQDQLVQRRCRRDQSLLSLPFPHGSFRSGQREIAELVYKCVDRAGQLLVEAPTGIGKTAAVLYPALKALATGKHDRIAYVTAKTVGKRTAEATLDSLRGAGLELAALSLTARERVCFSPGRACHGDDCSFARGYYDRLPAALGAALQRPTLGRGDIEELAREFAICPYQLALDLLPWVDMVIADLHYVYSLTATLGGLIRQDGRRWSVLLDEAHNLPERARRMYRASLGKASLMAVKRDAPRGLGAALERVNRAMLALQREEWREPDYDCSTELPVKLQQALADFIARTGDLLAQEPALLHRHPRLLDFYFEVLQFQRLADNWGEDFRFEKERGSDRQSLRLTLNCLDPARLLAERQQPLHSLTAFSATLSPPDWTRRTLGLGPEAVFRREASPFAASQLEVFLATAVDTRFSQRQQSLPRLAELLLAWLDREPGNCIIYFSSYRYLQDCLALLQAQGLESLRSCLWVQQREQEDAGRDQLLRQLETRRDVVALCILGGVFGEGIDLPGERLTSVVIVGVGLPQFNRDTRMLQAWYQQRCGAGFEYACLYPGMQKVDQALGRVIRASDDRGRALLVDSRYGQRQYRELLPPWWSYCAWEEAKR
ncbi:MAG: ATP-dependent DNA helicase [Ottowia sp.]|nr:ATP-dependent DNA helicase [Ottowia sp.]MCP5166233.1 ATP-dependent DNA helicase [Pseudomonadales bacterium]